MKLVCSKSDLLNGVQTVSKAVPNKTTMSILECVLIDARDTDIKLMANDMELGIETIIEGNIVEKGIIALDARIFLEIVRKLPDSEITIVTDDSLKTTITCEKSKFNIIGKSGEDFSYLPSIEKTAAPPARTTPASIYPPQREADPPAPRPWPPPAFSTPLPS